MKVAVLNYSGTVGKTTVAAHLLSPRMNEAPIFAIETINETAEGFGVGVEQIKGKNFRDLFKKLTMLDDAIIDIGASNIEAFIDGMVKFEDSHIEIDCFVIPVTNDDKVLKETIRMITVLSAMGVPAEKIKLVFNRVEAKVEEEFGPILNYAKKEKKCTANPKAGIFENELFDMVSSKKITISAALADETDYKALAREANKAGDAKMATKYIDMFAIKALAKNVNRNLDAVYAELFS
jgi:hypothetical protein